MKLSEGKQCENRCSKCGSGNIKWHNTKIFNTYVEQEWTCMDCETEGKDFYNLVYDNTSHYID